MSEHVSALQIQVQIYRYYYGLLNYKGQKVTIMKRMVKASLAKTTTIYQTKNRSKTIQISDL